MCSLCVVWVHLEGLNQSVEDFPIKICNSQFNMHLRLRVTVSHAFMLDI